MRRFPLTLLLALACALPAWAEDEAPAKKPRGVRVAEAATRIEKAVEAGDAKALAALARLKGLDPWLVADELHGRAAFDAADAYAKQLQGVETRSLPAYLTAARAAPTPAAERKIMAELEALMRARDAPGVAAKSASIPKDLNSVVRVRLMHARALALGALRRTEDSESAFAAAAAGARVMGWLLRAADFYSQVGRAASRRYAWDRALEAWTASLALAESRGDARGVARMRNNIGLVHREMGNPDEALAHFRRAVASAEAVGDAGLAANVLGNIGIVHEDFGDLAEAVRTYERAVATKLKMGDKAGAALTMANIGAVLDRLGNYRRALATYKRALKIREALGDQRAVASSIGDIASIHHALGEFAKALSTYERAVAMQEKLRDPSELARTLSNLTGVHAALGDQPRALAAAERALALFTEIGDRAAMALARGNIGVIHGAMGDLDAALAAYKEAYTVLESLGRKGYAATMLGNIGQIQLHLGRVSEARVSFERALAAQEAMGDRATVEWTRLMLGRVHLALGDLDTALAVTEKAKRAARRLRATPLFVESLRNLAELHLVAGDAGSALAEAELALDALEDLLGGLGEEAGASARASHAKLFALGTVAAVRENNLASALLFLESGRAGALLDALGGPEALRWKAESLPAELRDAENGARVAVRRARRAYDTAVRRRKRAEAKAAGVALEKARDALGSVIARIQRELKQQAGLFYPRAETIEGVQRTLRSDQALVLYGLGAGEALALVLRADAARVVPLGPAKAVEAACGALDASNQKADPAPALAALRSALVTPLKLDAAVKQVIVSPDGALCYLPFGALFTRPVALTPSATTHALLLEDQRAPGKGVLALGAPDYEGVSKGAQAVYYRGRGLSALPASRVEAMAVGSTVLLGKDASESGLRKTLGTVERWRSVHFACHGLVDVERPMLSSLALSSDGEDDGFVAVNEILRMPIPADLAVLSACETGRGKLVGGEGIVGLTRAFMFAGAPRVICSSWKVDDEATQALMIKFYELWNPAAEDAKGLPVCEALQQAQAYIRGQKKWAHPYFWAAWTLWGLPD